jgi:YD repeat-containing protein
LLAFSQTGYDALGRPQCSALRMDMAAAAGPLTDPCVQDTRGERSHGPDRISRSVYDELGRVRESWSGVGTADEARDVATSWTDNGAVASVTDANGNSTSYAYDGHDRLKRTTYPAAAPHGATYEELSYESVNGGLHNSPLVASFRNRAGETIHFGYDALGRLASKDVPNVRPYEADVSYGYDNLGALTSTSDGLGHVQIFEHDVHGNLLAEHSNWYGSVRSQYDHAGRRMRLTWPDGFFVSYDYRVTGEMAAIRENGGAVLASFSYDELGRRTGIARGNGTVTSYGYDAASRLASLTQELAGTDNDAAATFRHNPAMQIASETRSNPRYQWSGGGNGTVTSTPNALNQIAAHNGVAFSYDAKGNLTSDGTRSFAYTGENRLASGPRHQPLLRPARPARAPLRPADQLPL